jgi:hypothetical protein
MVSMDVDCAVRLGANGDTPGTGCVARGLAGPASSLPTGPDVLGECWQVLQKIAYRSHGQVRLGQQRECLVTASSQKLTSL